MKKLLIVANVFTLCLLYYSSCTSTNQLYDKSNNTSFFIKNSPGYAACYNCAVDNIHGETPNLFADVTRRFKCTSGDFYQNYMRGQQMLFNTPLAPSNQVSRMSPNIDAAYISSRSCWFHIDTLKKFICLMEQYSAKKNITSDKLGVRFYYGIYNNFDAPRPEYNNKQTLFLVPTCYDGSFNWDFDPREWVKNSTNMLLPLSNFTLAAKLNDSVRKKEKALILAPSALNASMNEGDLCPPKTGCNSTINAIDNYFGANVIYQ